MRSQYYENKSSDSHKTTLAISKLQLGKPDLVLRLNTVIDDGLDFQSSACSLQSAENNHNWSGVPGIEFSATKSQRPAWRLEFKAPMHCR